MEEEKVKNQGEQKPLGVKVIRKNNFLNIKIYHEKIQMKRALYYFNQKFRKLRQKKIIYKSFKKFNYNTKIYRSFF